MSNVDAGVLVPALSSINSGNPPAAPAGYSSLPTARTCLRALVAAGTSLGEGLVAASLFSILRGLGVDFWAALILTGFAVLFTAATNGLFNSGAISDFKFEDYQTAIVGAVTLGGTTFGGYWANVVAQQAGAKLGMPESATNTLSLLFYSCVVISAAFGGTTLIDQLIRQLKRRQWGEHHTLIRTSGSPLEVAMRFVLAYGILSLLTSGVVVMVEAESSLNYAQNPNPGDLTANTVAAAIRAYPILAYLGALFDGFFEVCCTLSHLNIAEDALTDLYHDFSWKKLGMGLAIITASLLASAVLIALGLLNNPNGLVVTALALNSMVLMFKPELLMMNAVPQFARCEFRQGCEILNTAEPPVSFALPLKDHHHESGPPKENNLTNPLLAGAV